MGNRYESHRTLPTYQHFYPQNSPVLTLARGSIFNDDLLAWWCFKSPTLRKQHVLNLVCIYMYMYATYIYIYIYIIFNISFKYVYVPIKLVINNPPTLALFLRPPIRHSLQENKKSHLDAPTEGTRWTLISIGCADGEMWYPLVICYITMENHHRNSEFYH